LSADLFKMSNLVWQFKSKYFGLKMILTFFLSVDIVFYSVFS